MMGLFDDLYGTPEPAPEPAKKPAKPVYKPLTPVAQPAPVVPPAAQAVDAEFVPSKPPPGLSPRALNDFKLSEANRIAAAKIKKAEEERAATRKIEEEQRNANKKSLTETQSNATAFGMRMLDSNKIINELEDKGVTDTGIFRSIVSGTLGITPLIGEKLEDKTAAAMNVLPTFLGGPSAEQQQVDQARRNFVTANLRKESGAAISPAEFATEEKKYFPQLGDAPAVIKQKRDARELAIKAMNIQSGNNIPNLGAPLANTPPVGAPPTAKQAPDGKWYAPDPARPGKYLQY
jgi:hypothetical protein